MSLNRNIRHCKECVLLTRQLTDCNISKDGTRAARNMTYKFSGSVNTIRKTKMPNQKKLLVQLKDFINKSGYDKSLQFILSKEWIDLLQKATYAQIDIIRKLSLTDVTKDNTVPTKSVTSEKDLSEKSIAVTLQENEKHEDNLKELHKKQLQVNQLPDKSPTHVKTQVVDASVTTESPSNFSQFISTLIWKLKSRTTESALVNIPKWKKPQYNVSKHSIASRTRHVLNSIITAESSASRWRRIEDLLTHIDQYPEARHYAIKEGAVMILLKARQRAKDEQIKASIREALAVMGYVDPLPGQGIRILTIDGGGIRGVLVVEMLKKLEELTGLKTHQMFDYICGVSTGAILSAVLGGHKRKSLTEINELYKEMSKKAFTQSTLKGTSSLVWSHAYYDTALWERLLQETIGDKLLIKTTRDPKAPKFAAVSAVVNHARVMAYVFRNYTLPHRIESQYMGSHKHKLWEAARASAAAPSYFEEYKCGEYLHQDGGILVNNPCAVAIHEAKHLWPNNPIQCVVSFGTGRIPNRILENENDISEVAISSWKEKFYKILDSATDTEAVHIMLNDLLPDHIYFRFNPYLTEMVTMTEIREEKLDQLEQDAKMYIRRNEEKFQKVANALTKKRKLHQKIGDWVTLQKQMHGF